MTIDVGFGFASNEAAYRKARTAAPWLAVAAVFVAAVLLRQVMPFNVDVSWWLIVSERMLDGQRLYVDILETNPPMAVSVYLLGVALARAIGVRPEVVTDGLVFVLIAASLRADVAHPAIFLVTRPGCGWRACRVGHRAAGCSADV